MQIAAHIQGLRMKMQQKPWLLYHLIICAYSCIYLCEAPVSIVCVFAIMRRQLQFITVTAIAALAAAQPAKWDRDHPTGAYNNSASFRIRTDVPACNETEFSYRVLSENFTDGTHVVLESGGLTTQEFNHSIFLSTGNYSVILSNHQGNVSCAPGWSLYKEDGGRTFFSYSDGFAQESRAFFTIDENLCFNLTKYSTDFAPFQATYANSTCFNGTYIPPTEAPTESAAPPAPACPGINLTIATPVCEASNFTYRLLKGINQTDVDSGFVTDLHHTIPICDTATNYTVLLSNHGSPSDCSPPSWSISDLNGTVFFTSHEKFVQASEASFQFVSDKCMNITQYGADFHYAQGTADESSCAAVAPTEAPTTTVAPTSVAPTTEAPVTVVPTEPSTTAVPDHHDAIPDQTTSSSNHFWLHTFWGIFLIVLFCLLALAVIGYIAYSCMKKEKASDAERQPLVGRRAEA
eukprot:TRINITY_DN288_c0_g1_i1.p1 TRINITY_DN288_c0_g1~~TRINITY_DN288_c0_g1_i1.p1  ORF type:complete len:463 (+),score=119.56 TRINITY_DN288_c0_g1_i1:725-2113(+)